MPCLRPQPPLCTVTVPVAIFRADGCGYLPLAGGCDPSSAPATAVPDLPLVGGRCPSPTSAATTPSYQRARSIALGLPSCLDVGRGAVVIEGLRWRYFRSWWPLLLPQPCSTSPSLVFALGLGRWSGLLGRWSGLLRAAASPLLLDSACIFSSLPSLWSLTVIPITSVLISAVWFGT